MSWEFPYRGETRDLDDAVRAAAGGAYVRLPQGVTHYELAGPPTGEPVVLVHGFSVPYFIWDPTFERLASTGRRTVRYDLFGRGFSDRPHVRYGLSLFVEQLASLLDALDIQRADLVGLSMGGAVSAAFTARHPARVRRLVLIDPVGVEGMPLSTLYKAALLPGISEAVLSLVGTDRMVEGLASDFFDPAEVERFRDRYRSQMQYRGFKRAIVSTLRNGAVRGSPDDFRRLGELNTPVMLIWGREDRTLPLEQSESILAFVPRAEFFVIEGAGHIPNCERPEVVHPLMERFLSNK